MSSDGVRFDDDSEILGAASLYESSSNQWAVSSTGTFISNPNGPRYKANTDSQITNTLSSELYKTARISPSSLRYYGIGLENGGYLIQLHFAEIQMDDSPSWRGLGRRLFDVYVQVHYNRLNFQSTVFSSVYKLLTKLVELLSASQILIFLH